MPITHALVNTFRALVGAYGLSVTGFLILRLLVDESWQIVALFNSFIHVLVLGGVVLLAITLLFQQFRLSLLLMPSLLAAGIWFSADFLPKETPPVTADALRVVTFNVRSSTSDFEVIADVLREADADVIALQEVEQGHAAYYEFALADFYPELRYQAGSAISGKLILSRHPIIGYETQESDNFTHQRVEIEFNDRVVTLFNIHTVMPIPARFDERNAEIATIMEWASEVDDAVILVGDFNMTPQSDPYQDMTAVYADAFDEAGQGFGFSFSVRDIPLARIDYIFYDDDTFTAAETDILDVDTNSDHRPILAILAIDGISPG